MQQHLGRRLGVGQGAVPGPGRDSEELGQRGEPDPPPAPFEQAAGERGGTERRLPQPTTVQAEQLPLEEALIEARVVGDEEIVAGKSQEAPHNGRDRGRAPEVTLEQPGQIGDGLGERNRRLDERLERIDELERLHPHCPQLADAVAGSGKAGRLEIEDHERGLIQERIVSCGGEGDGRAGAEEPAVAGGQVGEQRARQSLRDRRGGEERPRGLHRRERASLLEELDQPVERIKRKLHSPIKANIRSLCNGGQSGNRGIVGPEPRRSRTARVIAAAPNRPRTSSSAASRALPSCASTGSTS